MSSTAPPATSADAIRIDAPSTPTPARDGDAAAWVCPSCGTDSPGEFCPACGERRLDARDRSIRGFVADAFRSVTSVDSTLFRSLRLLVTRPGVLTAEHAAGRRRGYVPPLQLFLLCNVAFFAAVALTGFNIFTTPLRIHLTALPHSELAVSLVRAEIARRGTTLAEYRVGFDRAIATQAKTLVVVMVPMLAVFVQLLRARGRRWFVDSLAFSFHVLSWLMLLLTLMHGILQAGYRIGHARGWDVEWLLGDGPVTLFLGFLIWTYMAVAMRTAFGGGRIAAVARGLLLTMSFMLVVQAYRFVLFCTTFISV